MTLKFPQWAVEYKTRDQTVTLRMTVKGAQIDEEWPSGEYRGTVELTDIWMVLAVARELTRWAHERFTLAGVDGVRRSDETSSQTDRGPEVH